MIWRITASTGIAITARDRIADAASLVALIVLLDAANLVLPIELAGLAALGPVLLARLWLYVGNRVFARPALVAAAPYLELTAALAVTPLVPVCWRRALARMA